MKAKTKIIIGMVFILIGILLFFLSPLFLPYCDAVAYNACLNAVTGKEVSCFRDSTSFGLNVNCADFYQNLAPLLIIIGVFLIIISVGKNKKIKSK